VFKELFIAACYTLGVSLVPLFQSWPIELNNWLFLLVIFLLALSNLLLFSVREVQNDLKDKNPSAIRFMGIHSLKRILQVLLWSQIMLSLYLFLADNVIHGLLLLIMSGLMACLYYFPKPFSKDEAYRVLGDGIFLVPLLANSLTYLLSHL